MKAPLPFALLALLASGVSAQVGYANDFQTPVGSEWSRSERTDVDGNGRFGLGAFDNASARLTLSGFTPGSAATLAFDFYCLSSWDGSGAAGGPDVFFAQADGVDLLRASFSNIVGQQGIAYPQTYSPATPLGGALVAGRTGADERDALTNYAFAGYGSAVYKFGGGMNPLFTFTPKASTVVFTFGATGLEALPNEGWAVDNVRVTQAVPEPASFAAMGVGALAFLRRRRRV